MSQDQARLIAQADALRRAGRLGEAVALYERVLVRWPGLPDCWYNLALSYRQLGRFSEALTAYQQALDRQVSKPEEVHLNRGVIFSDHLRRADAAEAEWHTALALNPSYLPALLNLANLREEQARRDEALALYERILALDSQHAEALARYVNLKQPASPDDPLVARVISARDSARTAPAEKASLGFALGKVLDACGAYDEAFAAYARANRDSRDSARGMANYDRRRHEQFIDDLIATFATAHNARQKSSQPQPIFICGMFRSGSTLVEQVLASHPHVTAGGEIDFLPTLVRSELAPFPAAMKNAGAEKLADIARRYRDRLKVLFPAAERITDKRPDNFLHIGLIKALFPDARIVNTVRNPLDNCLSVYFLHLDHGMSYALDLLDTAHYYRHYRRLMAHWKALYGPDILDFDYDAFVRDPRPATRELLAFCGLDWNDACLAFHQAKNVVKTESVWQVREPLYRRASGRWRNYARHLGRLRADLKDLIDEAGEADRS